MQRRATEVADELLVLHAQDGSVQAMNALAQRWHRRLLAHALSMTRNANDAADAVQESWLAIVKGLRSLHDPAMFKPWAYRIVTNKSADVLRRKYRDRAIEKNLQANREPQVPGGDFNDESIALRRAIETLPVEHRTLLSMFYSAGMSVAQVAEALQLPAGTVKSRLHHLRNELRSAIENQMTERSSP